MTKNKITQAPVMLFDSEKKYIESGVMKPDFPWYWINEQIVGGLTYYAKNLPEKLYPHLPSTNGPYLSHALLKSRPPSELSNRPATDYSPSYETFIEIFHRWMVENNLPYTKIFRANLNLNWHNGVEHTVPHVDHEFNPHNNFIMYLNTQPNSQTIIWSEDFNDQNLIECQQYTAVSFPANWHAHYYPPQGERRVVFVVTYA